ncbi:MAG: hypothetical protein GYB65_10410 [Chloroflexi bacterium]|nr:hypothetical protein [Chloroflexota bacterium]
MTNNASGAMNLGFVVEVVEGDALAFETDVLVVKHAPTTSGLGAVMRKYLTEDAAMLPGASEYRVWPGTRNTRAEYILMVGAPPAWSMRYPQLRDLARRMLDALWEQGLDVRHMTTTVHGIQTAAGLDEVEAFRALLLGMADAYETGHYPPTLERITFIEHDTNRVRLFQQTLTQFLPTPPPPTVDKIDTATMAVMAGKQSFEPAYRKPEADDATPHVFVAMPFADAYEDHYYLAIQPAVRETGLLCERMDLDTFTGDIMDHMLERIRTARLVIAVLDGANPNVYLEVGYAWGVQTPTVLIAHEEQGLPFDVRGHRVLMYDRIYRLKQMLQAELATLLS